MVIERKKYNIDPIKNTRRITMNLKRQARKQKKHVIRINIQLKLIDRIWSDKLPSALTMDLKKS